MYSWPDGKQFAFTVVDDTDFATVQNVKPIYDLLISLNIKTTKTVWVYPSRNKISGESLQDPHYTEFVLDLQRKGFEIAMHGVGSGRFNRQEIFQGYEVFNKLMGHYPQMHINHSGNTDNLYWGYHRFGSLLRSLFYRVSAQSRRFHGEWEKSEFFWGDLARKHIRYIRDKVYLNTNTLKADPKMPYRRADRAQSNFWFSASDGHTAEEFNDLIEPARIDQLKKEGGLCIVFTHFACGFLTANSQVDPQFKARMTYLAQQNGWFAPATTILDYIQAQRSEKAVEASPLYTNVLDFKWLIHRLYKRFKYGR